MFTEWSGNFPRHVYPSRHTLGLQWNGHDVHWVQQEVSPPCLPIEAHTGPLTEWTGRSLSGVASFPAMSTHRGIHWASNGMDTTFTGYSGKFPRHVYPSRHTLGL
ncbi:hypothetical protein B0H13DRAFT_1928424 [Mycena leptocephala]|nr:hypothetical protein B0H13DRAFT_1928424 [Mycena leptocephala]